MSLDNFAAIISGDFAMKDGELKYEYITDEEGVQRVESFMRYRSTIDISERIFERPEDIIKMPVEIWVPEGLFFDKPISVIANIFGRVYIHTSAQAIAYAEKEQDNEEVRAIIEVVVAYRHPAEEQYGLVVRPVITLIGRVTSKSNPNLNGFNSGSHSLRMESSTYIMGQQKRMKVEYVIR